MGVDRALFKGIAQTIRGVFDDFFESCDFLAVMDQPDYDAPTGMPLWHNVPPVSGIRVAFLDYNEQERLAAQVPPENDRALIAALDAPGLTPKPGDLIRRPGGREPRVHEIVAVINTGGADALWDMQVKPYHDGWPF